MFGCQDNLEDISRLESTDNGKPIYESRMDTDGCAESLAFFGGVAPTIAGEYISSLGCTLPCNKEQWV